MSLYNCTLYLWYIYTCTVFHLGVSLLYIQGLNLRRELLLALLDVAIYCHIPSCFTRSTCALSSHTASFITATSCSAKTNVLPFAFALLDFVAEGQSQIQVVIQADTSKVGRMTSEVQSPTIHSAATSCVLQNFKALQTTGIHQYIIHQCPVYHRVPVPELSRSMILVRFKAFHIFSLTI